MTTAIFDPDRATGTLIFTHGTRLTPAIKAVLGALALDVWSASAASQHLAFSGESSATWRQVLAHFVATSCELGIAPPAAAEPIDELRGWLLALAEHAGAADKVAALLDSRKLTLADPAPIDDLVELAKLIDDGHGLAGFRIEEYSVNVTDGQCHPWNPFDNNFPSQAAAEEAAEEYLLEDDECVKAIIGRVVVVDNVLETDDADDNLATILRADLVQQPATPAM